MKNTENNQTDRTSDLSASAGSVKYIYRIDDGERWTLQENGKYTMDSSRMFQKYEYTYKELMDRSLFSTQNDFIAKQLDTLADQWNELTHEQKYTK